MIVPMTISEVAMSSSPTDYISRDQLQDMWGAGFTVIRRDTFGHDIYELADRVKRPGMARQWFGNDDLRKAEVEGWRQVLSEDYPGLFAPHGYAGAIEIGGMHLFELPQHRVDRAKQSAVEVAAKQIDDWAARNAAQGFAGGATVINSGGATVVEVGKSFETTTHIPRDMMPWIGPIFEERDRLYGDLVGKWNAGQELSEEQMLVRERYFDVSDADPTALKGPTLNALLLPIAIANVRKRTSEESNVQAS